MAAIRHYFATLTRLVWCSWRHRWDGSGRRFCWACEDHAMGGA